MEKTLTRRGEFIKIIKEACEALGYELIVHSQGWMLEIKNTSKSTFIMGYSFATNPASSCDICRDKTATTAVLNSKNIDNIQHIIFHNYRDYNSEKGSFSRMQKYLSQYNKIVVKPNSGTGGNGVYVVRNEFDMEKSVIKLFSQYPTVAFSPFEKILSEYRVVILEGEQEIIYKKTTSKIAGNGKDSILKLLIDKFQENIPSPIFKHLYEKEIDLNSVLPSRETLALAWKHNLGNGTDVTLEIEEGLKDELSNIAKKSAKALGMNFCTVDIVTTETNEIKVLEVNSGVTLISFSQKSPENYKKTVQVYKQAIKLSF